MTIEKFDINPYLLTVEKTESQPEIVRGPYKTIAMIDAVDANGDTDLTAVIFIKLEATGEVFPLRLGQTFKAPTQFKEVRLHWAAQPGITVKLGLSQEALWDARPASMQLIGEVSVSKAETLDSVADQVIEAGTTELLDDADATRRELVVHNLATNAETFRIGGSDAGATNGLPLAPGETQVWTTSAAIHAYNPGAGDENLAVVLIHD